MITKFVNRKEEIDFFERKFQEKVPQVIILYGRRRVGKSRLMREFLKGKKSVYFLSSRTVPEIQAAEFARVAADALGDETFEDVKYDWLSFFKHLAGSKERIVIAIDEFPYLIESDKSTPSVFQKIIDLYLVNSNISLILCGSSVGMMETEVLGYNSPLYGRRTGQWKLGPMKIRELHEFLPKYNAEQLIHTYAVVGGVPFYLNRFDDSVDIFENISREILSKGEILNEEAEFLLREEVREPKTYFSILNAIAFGNTTFDRIMNYTGIDKNSITKYIDTLKNLGFVKRVVPITEKIPTKSKKGIYAINDNYLAFWFRFVFLFKGYLEGDTRNVLKTKIVPYFDGFCGKAFEDVSKQFLCDLNARGKLPFVFEKIGSWWNRNNEIDLIAIDEGEKEFLFVECKWTNKKTSTKIIIELIEKAKCVDITKHERKEHFCVISKTGFTENAINFAKAHRVILFDLMSFNDFLGLKK